MIKVPGCIHAWKPRIHLRRVFGRVNLSQLSTTFVMLLLRFPLSLHLRCACSTTTTTSNPTSAALTTQDSLSNYIPLPTSERATLALQHWLWGLQHTSHLTPWSLWHDPVYMADIKLSPMDFQGEVDSSRGPRSSTSGQPPQKKT